MIDSWCNSSCWWPMKSDTASDRERYFRIRYLTLIRSRGSKSPKTNTIFSKRKSKVLWLMGVMVHEEIQRKESCEIRRSSANVYTMENRQKIRSVRSFWSLSFSHKLSTSVAIVDRISERILQHNMSIDVAWKSYPEVESDRASIGCRRALKN
jgi:hypothetical protein